MSDTTPTVAGPDRFFESEAVYECIVDDQWLETDASNPSSPRLWLWLSFKFKGRLHNPWDLSNGVQQLPELKDAFRRLRLDVLPANNDFFQRTLETLRSYGFAGTDTTRLSLDDPQPIDLRGKTVFVKCKKKQGNKSGQVFVNFYLQKNMQQAAAPRTSIADLKAFAAQHGGDFPQEQYADDETPAY